MTKNIGKYEIISKLGEGGMGTVYLANDRSINRKVAIKVMNTGDPHLVKRMMREAQAIASLEHPNIVEVYEVLIYQDLPCIVMRYLPGTTLCDYTHDRDLSLKDKSSIFIKVVDAVAHAHQQNLIHRDVKPDNIIVSKDGEPYLMDFGLVKRLKVDSSLTRTGVVLGSPTYMSPEQARGEVRTLNELTDVYSLGAVLYEIICGIPLIEGDNIPNILIEVTAKAPIKPRKINSQIPYSLECICLKALQKKKKHRYKSAADFSNDLQNYLSKKKTKAEKWFWHKKMNKFLVVICVLLCYCSFYIWHHLGEKQFNIDIRITSAKGLLDNAYNLMDYGLNDEALDEFKSVLSKIKPKDPLYNKLSLGMLEIHKRQKNWNDLKQLYNREFVKKKIAKADISMAYMYFENKEYVKVSKYMQYKVNEKDEIAVDYFYLQAQMSYEVKIYEKAIASSLQVQKLTNDNRLKSLAKLLSAKSYFRMYEKKSNEDYLERSKKILEELKKKLPNIIEVYEYLGRCSLLDRNLEEANVYFQKCIEMEPANPLYYDLLSKVQIELQEFANAYKSIIKAIDVDPESNITNTPFIDFSYRNPRHQQNHYTTMLYYSKNFVKLPPPSFIQKELESVENKYKDQYENLQWLRTQHNLKELNLQSSFFKTKTQIRGYFNLLRHNQSFPRKIEDFIDKNLPNNAKKPSLKILKTFIDKKDKELSQANYYRLIRWSLYRDNKIFQEWKRGTFSAADKQNLRSIFQQQEQEFLYQYLAGKALLYLGDSAYLEKHIKNKEFSLQKLIAIIVLREKLVHVEVKPIVDYLRSKQKYSLCDLLAIRVMYLRPESLTSEASSLLNKIMALSKHEKLRLCAAEIIFRAPNVNEKIWKKAENVFLEEMDSLNEEYRFFSHYYFWRNRYVYRRLNDYWPYYKKGWSEHSSITSIMVLLVRDDIIPPGKKEQVKQYIIRHLDIERQKGKSLSTLQLQAVRILFSQFENVPLSYVQNDHSFLKTLAYNNRVVEKLKNVRKVQENLKFLKKNLQKTQVKNYSDKYHKVFVYYVSSLFGFHTLDSLDNENDTVKSHVFQNMCFAKYGVLSNFEGKQNFATSVIGELIKKEIGDRWKTQDKIKLIKKYISHKNKSVKRNALMAYYAYIDDIKKKQLFKKYLNKNNEDREMLASCIYDIIKLIIFSRILHPDELKSLNTNYYMYLEAIKKRKHHHVISEYFNRAIKLDPGNPLYIFERALLWSYQGKENKAIVAWEKVITSGDPSSQEVLLARLKLSEIYVRKYDGDLARNKVEVILGSPIKEEILEQDNDFLARIARIYAKLKLWKQSRFLFEHVFLRVEEKGPFTLDRDALFESDKKRVMRFLSYFRF